MAMIEIRDVRYGTTLARVVRGWWPVPVVIATSVIAQQLLLTSRYDVAGHAGEHLGSASAPFMAAAVLAIVLWATPPARRQVDVIAAAGAWLATTVVVLIGNVRVIDDLVRAGYGDTPTGSVPDVADHSLANVAIWPAVAAAALLVASFRWRGHIGNLATIGALAAMIFPPWIIPGAGIVVLTIVRCVARHRTAPAGGRRLRQDGVRGVKMKMT
jgi:hypothetical protein